ncbi:3',5'-cyclic-nucleotide phosphodiesterase [bacterium]|nr:3',5'-cyclic-nucleotide phosphodiesterase [bacterium]
MLKNSLSRWCLFAGLVMGGFASCGARGPAFSVVTLGCEGGLAEGNLSCYLLTRPGSGAYVALDAGTVLGGLRQAVARGSLNDCQPERGSNQSHEGWVLRQGIKAYLVSHAHIDHVSGLVIDSTDDTSKPLLGLDPTIDDLRDHLFNWKTWPNFGSEGERPLNQYRYQRLSEGNRQPIQGTDLEVQAFTLSHSNHYPSSAFLVRGGDQYLLYCGDTGPDEVERSQCLERLWAAVAPLIREGRLRGILLESSYPDGREPGLLFGHLTPEWMMKELHRLAQSVDPKNPQRALAGLKIAVTHIKPSLEKGRQPRELVQEQLKARNDLGIVFLFPEQGRRLEF